MMTTGDGIEIRLGEILARITGIHVDDIGLRTPLLRGGLELDSLSIASFVAAVEEEFGVDILEEDLTLESLQSLSAMANFIKHAAGDH